MSNFHKSWIDQCDAAPSIRERFGLDHALGYLVGEKLLKYIRTADKEASFAAELPAFIAAVREQFEPHEIRGYLDNVRRVGAPGHTMTEAQHALAREAGMFGEEDIVRTAEDIVYMDRIREMLLG